MLVHDFGPTAQYLFQPCELYDNFFEEMVKQTDKDKAVSASNAVAASQCITCRPELLISAIKVLRRTPLH